ncbi:ABC transporter permease [Nakamurella lactea]|uniref:ABC transporter permease n=1 Tax=Nakamurella lactea TaxID=459515 RepID=UPI0004028903|nr:ABC transporter permease [Nakamurella lactea]
MTTATLTGRRPANAHPWLRFAVRRFGGLLVGLAVLLVATFLMVHLIPGDPVRNVVGLNAKPEDVERMREALGLNLPLWQQFGRYLSGLFTGDLGISLRTRIPVSTVVASGLSASASLAAVAFVAVILIAVPLGMTVGVLTARGRRRALQTTFTAVTGLFASIPGFLLAVGLVYFFAVANPWLPVSGRAGWTSYLMPVTALAIAPIAGLSRIVRSQTAVVLGEDYLRTARSKQLPDRLLYLRHTLPNLLTATLTIGGMLLPGLLGGAVIIENVFNWPGIGTQVVIAVTGKDFPVAQTIILILGAAVLIVNAVVDLIIAAIDPRSTLRED